MKAFAALLISYVVAFGLAFGYVFAFGVGRLSAQNPPGQATAEYAQVVYQLEKLTERVDARLSAIDATLTAFKADALTQQNHAMEAVREDLAETQALLAKTRCATGTQ